MVDGDWLCTGGGGGGGFDDGRRETSRGEHESATLEVRRSHHSGSAAGSATDVTAAVTVPFASSEDDRNLQTVSSPFLVSSLRCCSLYVYSVMFCTERGKDNFV